MGELKGTDHEIEKEVHKINGGYLERSGKSNELNGGIRSPESQSVELTEKVL